MRPLAGIELHRCQHRHRRRNPVRHASRCRQVHDRRQCVVSGHDGRVFELDRAVVDRTYSGRGRPKTRREPRQFVSCLFRAFKCRFEIEETNDRASLYAVNASAFESSAEADLVDALREQARPIISPVAEKNGKVVGHVMFSPVSLSGHPDLKVMGLAPMAVAPDHQRQAIGSALVRAGLEQCKQLGFVGVIVLGHAAYYPRFGFSPFLPIRY